jgi:hypothetical protein
MVTRKSESRASGHDWPESKGRPSAVGSWIRMAVFALGTCLAGTACGSGGSTAGEMGNQSMTSSSLVGVWTLDFQWSGRTSGVLILIISPDQTCQQLSGPGVSATSGTVSVSGNTATWVLEDGTTWSGTTSGNTIAGTMINSSGGMGVFNGTDE